MHSWTPWIIFGGIALLSYAVQANLKRKFATYSKVMLRNGMSGRDVAVAMLRDENVHGVEVVSTQGHLTDHYDPSSGTIRLSESVFQERNVAAAAVAAHECGHAVQHARAYAPLAMRLLRFAVGPVGYSGRNPAIECISVPAFSRRSPICLYNNIQPHHATCRNRREQTRHCVVTPIKYRR